MRKHALLYGIVAGTLIAVLELIEYRWLVLDHAVEIYGGLIAAIFSGVGLWLGLRLTRVRERIVTREIPVHVPVPVPVEVTVEVPIEIPVHVPVPISFARDLRQVAHLGVTPRELEILELIAEGLSNREIAARAFVSENTVKTHSSRLFDKLGARRRTQVVQRAKELRLIP